MYKFQAVADIKLVHWVYIVFAVSLLLILPIFANLYFFYDKDIKKFFFLLTVDRIALFGGYGERIKGGVALHLSENKAVIFSFKSIFGMRSQFSLRKDYYIRKIGVLTECGSENAPQIPFIYALSGNIFAKIFGAVSRETGCETTFQNDTVLYEDDTVFKISLRVNAVFNLFTVCITLAKIILRKLEKWIMKTK
ncbi:MAG: hypothetical protein DBX59_09935 [Bacillota bacterium]|nr:MAG: hypothetical protein DBX59_09935 [Bacillota bacterium]